MSTVDDPTALLDMFGSSFRELESLLHSSLLSKPLAETLEGCESDLDRATTQVTLAYIVYDLVWIYLRTRGQDPMQHSVINELDRVKQYFAKIKKAEDAGQTLPKSFKVDKAAASRFIKAAISSGLSQAAVPAPKRPAPPAPTYEVDHSTRFKHLADPQPARVDDSDEEILQVLHGSSASPKKSKKRKQPVDADVEPTTSSRPQPIDISSSPTPQNLSPEPSIAKESQSAKRARTLKAAEEDTGAQGDSSAVEVNAAEAGKTKRNSKRKHKKSVEGGTAE